jgi:hypothetical protein
MNLQEQLLQEHSKANTALMVAWIGHDPKRFATLMHFFLQGTDKEAQRSAWVMSYCVEAHPSLILPYISALFARCLEPNTHPALKRNTTRALQFASIPEADHALAMNCCFDWLQDPNEPVAIRCFSMSIIAQLSTHYPELKNELKQIIESALQYEDPSPAFKAHSKKILKGLNKR